MGAEKLKGYCCFVVETCYVFFHSFFQFLAAEDSGNRWKKGWVEAADGSSRSPKGRASMFVGTANVVLQGSIAVLRSTVRMQDVLRFAALKVGCTRGDAVSCTCYSVP